MIKTKIKEGKTYLGIELGSTRIKAFLIDDFNMPIASGAYEWENKFENGYWTYSLDDIHNGVKECYKDLSEDVMKKYGVEIESVASIGISAMMHGYLPFDNEGKLLAPFRTWRNTTTEKAAYELSENFDFNIPQRWSIAHLYQAMINGEPHVKDIAHFTTLSGYIHYLLTGEYIIGIGDGSGMFPVSGNDYNREMCDKFNMLAKQRGYDVDVYNLLPKIKCAGENAGKLSEAGAEFLDVSGKLKAGVMMCPPEGDAGTGMVATNSVAPKTGNVSAGTSIFAMLVLEKPLKARYSEIDIAQTPSGFPVAMVHCNNCSAEVDIWVKLFDEFAKIAGAEIDKSKIYELLYKNAMTGDADCGGVMAYNYLSGEHITEIESGCPMYFRTPTSKMNLANFMRSQLYSAMATLKIGMDILLEKEKVSAGEIMAHGGLFKTKGVAQQILADALGVAVSVTETASEGGAWGMALLASYMVNGRGKNLGDWLSENVFSKMNKHTVSPDKAGAEGFCEYIKLYKDGIKAEKSLEDVKY